MAIKRVHQINPDSILREPLKKRRNQRNPKFVETALTEIGECCGVDLCTGIVRHYDPIDGEIVEYSIEGGVFGVRAPVTAGIPKKKFRIGAGEIYKLDKESRPMGQVPMNYMEDILNEQSNCCGADCCGTNMIRLPNYSENVIYEFGVQGGTPQTPATVDGITSGTINRTKRTYKIVPEAIVKKTSRHREGSLNGYKTVNYFEEVQEQILGNGHYGFNCCEGYLFLPDQTVADSYYRVSIASDAFVLTPVDSCNAGATGHSAAITLAAGDDVTPAVITLSGTWETGESLTVNLTHSIDGAESSSHIITAGPLTATAAAAQIDGNLTYTSVVVTASGATIEFLADTATETLNIDSITVA